MLEPREMEVLIVVEIGCILFLDMRMAGLLLSQVLILMIIILVR